MLKNQSEISTISGPEFINLEPLDINPLLSMCDIKVFYLGKNRNGSYIDKEAAIEMSKTLRGTPIVAAYSEDKEDFGDHGDVIHIEDGEITFSCKTVPYGFVSPDSQVWFQNFIDTDPFGNAVERTYLMTTGYLWTGQFPELTKVITEGQPQSMELDSKNVDGSWATDNNLGYEIFIINDAGFSKLCILGDSVEPCFEGAAVTAPEVSKNFTKDKAFSELLFALKEEINNALDNKGGQAMDPDNIQETEVTEEAPAEVIANQLATDADVEDNTDAEVIESFVQVTEEIAEPEAEVEEQPATVQHSLEEWSEIEQELFNLRAEVEELRKFKMDIETDKKNTLFEKFASLSGEEYNTLKSEKDKYSVDEIESKLCVMYVHQNANLDSLAEEEDDDEGDVITSFSLEDTSSAEIAPSFLEALRRTVLD